ncbi:MAG TPA: glycerol-3-phosphate 1-O-acyltransferase PlsY [Steroidobacteraceae bacterium]
MIAEFVVKMLVSYLLGSVVGALLIGKLRGVDIRRLGSGNAGGTNALRTQGKAFAFWVMAIDIGKGWLATGPIARLIVPGLSHRVIAVASISVNPQEEIRRFLDETASSFPWFDPAPDGWLAAACGIAVILGHVYPIFYGFRGGKGVATLIGSVLGMNPLLIIPMLVTWLLAVLLFGFVGLASILGTFALAAIGVMGVLEQHLPVLALYVLYDLRVMGSQLYLFSFGVLATVLIVFTHRSNIARMRSGTESRAQRLWLFASRGGGV